MTSCLAKIARRFERQYGVITRRQALDDGMAGWEIDDLVAKGTWLLVRRGIYRLRGVAPSAESEALVACLATGGRCSHETAAWLWGLRDAPPEQPVVTVGRHDRSRYDGIIVHRTADLRPRRAPELRRIPCTDLYRTLVDVASVLDDEAIDDAVDRALARPSGSLGGLVDELRRRAGRGNRGTSALDASLHRRGFLGAPTPSVLESKFLRLLRRGRITPIATEQHVYTDDGTYRLDVTLCPGVAAEVDGFAYHWNDRAKRRDKNRRRAIRATGMDLLVYDWTEVTRQGDEVLAEIRSAMAEAGAFPSGARDRSLPAV